MTALLATARAALEFCAITAFLAALAVWLPEIAKATGV
jgi:hypothetical protein